MHGRACEAARTCIVLGILHNMHLRPHPCVDSFHETKALNSMRGIQRNMALPKATLGLPALEPSTPTGSSSTPPLLHHRTRPPPFHPSHLPNRPEHDPPHEYIPEQVQQQQQKQRRKDLIPHPLNQPPPFGRIPFHRILGDQPELVPYRNQRKLH